MEVADGIERSHDRSTQIKFRLSRQRRERLQQLAADQGVTVQAYLEAKAFDEPLRELSPSSRKPHQNERLFDIAG